MKEIDEELSAHVLLERADQSKSGSIVKGLEIQNSLENTKFSKTLAKTGGVLSNHNH